MLNQFYIVFENRALDSFSLKHIQYNILKRLRELKYVSYRRIDVVLTDVKEEGRRIEWDDKKTANIKCYVGLSFGEPVADKRSTQAQYRAIFNGLEVLWEANQWNVDDLRGVYSEIEQEDFASSISYGKTLASPCKKHKAAFFCEIYPEYCDYYLLFLGNKGKVEQRIPFLHGHPDPGIFFNFFSNRAWRDNQYFLLSDINKEIFYIFNVNEPTSSLEYRPLNNTLEECKNYVAAFQANIPNSERLRLLEGFCPAGWDRSGSGSERL